METTNVKIGLRAVNEINYLYRPEKIGDKIDPSKIQIGFTNNIRNLNVENNLISVAFGAKYTYDGEELLQCIYSFDFNVVDLKNYVKFGDNKTVTVNLIMPYLIDVALGTLRGIILTKTYGTPLYSFPLPIINVEQLIKGMTAPKAN